MRCQCKRRKSPSFANFVTFVSRKKAVGSGKNSISAGCRDAREALWVLVDCPSEFKVLASNCHAWALCIKELYRHSWKFYQRLKYRSSLIHKKNDSSPLRVEYSMQQTCWERVDFGIYCRLCRVLFRLFQIKKYIHTCYICIHSLKYFQSISPTRCKVRGRFAKLGDLQN